MPCSFEHERALQEQGIFFVAGVDEAGRGPLAGPVVAAAVVFRNSADIPAGLDDSKKLTAKKRDILFAALTTHPDIVWAASVQVSPIVHGVPSLDAPQHVRVVVSRMPSPRRVTIANGVVL